MQTLQYIPKDRQKLFAQEVLDVYAPIAYRLGMWNMKNELEDLSFKFLFPSEYRKISKKVNEIRKTGIKKIRIVKHMLQRELKKNHIKAEIYGRIKHLYSIYRKLDTKDRTIEQIYDITALRIVTDSIENCYSILGIIHNIWKPIPNTLKDYIAIPKPNMYQSLHTDVVIDSKPVEFQIRTRNMHEIAENGIAAHWRYKEVSIEKFDTKLSWLKQFIEWKRDFKDIKFDFLEDNIMAFTPKGDVIDLPIGSCPIDFAYAIHSSIGDKATGANINNKFVPLKTEIKNGDIVEIITSKHQHPSREWLKFVKTSKAKAKIKKNIRSLQKIPVKSIVYEEKKHEIEESIISCDYKYLSAKIALCCKPLPNDKIIGIVKGKKVMVHKNNCNFIKPLKGTERKKVNVRWKDIPSKIELNAEGINRTGLLTEVLNTIKAGKIDVESAKAKPLKNGIQCKFIIKLNNLNQLINIIDKVKRIKSIKNIYINELKST